MTQYHRYVAIWTLMAATALVAGCAGNAILFYDPGAPGFAGDRYLDDQATHQIQINKLQSYDPVRDADIALARGDQRFVAVKKYSYFIPGVTGLEMTRLAREKYGIKVISGTGGEGRPLDETLLDAATEYAKAYNEHLGEKVRAFSEKATIGW